MYLGKFVNWDSAIRETLNNIYYYWPFHSAFLESNVTEK